MSNWKVLKVFQSQASVDSLSRDEFSEVLRISRELFFATPRTMFVRDEPTNRTAKLPNRTWGCISATTFRNETKLGRHLQDHDIRLCDKFHAGATYWSKLTIIICQKRLLLTAIFAPPPPKFVQSSPMSHDALRLTVNQCTALIASPFTVQSCQIIKQYFAFYNESTKSNA